MKKYLSLIIIGLAFANIKADDNTQQDLTVKFVFPEMNYSNWYVEIPG